MSLLDDIEELSERGASWLRRQERAFAGWAASERGQETLLAVDFLTLSTKVGDYYADTGWYLPVHPDFHDFALRQRRYHEPFHPRSIVRLLGPGSEHWAWIVTGVLGSPSMAGRRAVIEDAVFCLEHARWHAAISTLLPVLEGVVADRSQILSGRNVGLRVEDILHEDTGPLDALSAIPPMRLFREELFANQKFEGVSLDDEALNRHLVLHGRSAAFGTELNALRTFLFLVALAELLDGAMAFRVANVPRAKADYLAEYGSLASLREWARPAAARVH